MTSAIFTGHVIDDAVRTAGLDGDRIAVPSSMVAIWQAVDNECPNPNADTDLTGWSKTGALNSITRVTSGWTAFGSSAIEYTCNANIASGEVLIDCPITDSITTRTCSCVFWVDPSSGAVGRSAGLIVTEIGGASATENHALSQTIVGGVNVLILTFPINKTDRTALRIRIRITPSVTGESFRTGGVMLTKTSFAVPYAPTTKAAGRVQIPATALSPISGWAGMRVLPKISALVVPSGGITLWRSEDGSLAVTWDAGIFTFTRTDGVDTETAFVRGSWVVDDPYTLLWKWSSSGIAISLRNNPFYTGEVAVLSDDFERPDALTLGTAPTGQVWRHDGEVNGMIVSGRYQRPLPVTGTCYEQIDLGERPIQQRCQASFSGTYGPFSAVVMICAAVDAPFAPGQTYLNGMVHPVFAVYQMNVSIYENNTHEGILGFDWPNIPGVTVEDTDPLSNTFGFFLLKTDGTVYDFSVAIDWDTSSITLKAAQGATLIGEASTTDPRIAQYGGRYTVWQSYFNQNTVPTADVIPRFDSVTAMIPVNNPDPVAIPADPIDMVDIGSVGDGTEHLNGDVLWYASGRGAIPADLDPGDDPSRGSFPRRIQYLWDAEYERVRRYRQTQIEGMQ